MMFKRHEMSEFLTYYSVIGDIILLDNAKIEETPWLGHGEVIFSTKTFHFNVHHVDDKQITDSICMTQPDDFNEFEIILHRDMFSLGPLATVNRKHIELACLRQLTRFALFYTPEVYPDVTHPAFILNNIYLKNPAALDYKPEVQTFFRDRCLQNEKMNQDAYMQSVAEALYYGGVNVKEFATDIETLRIVDPYELTDMLKASVAHLHNPLIHREIVNRINRIIGYDAEFTLTHPNYDIRIELY